MKIKEETSKLVADCPKHRFEVVDKTDLYNPNNPR
ncbi:chlorohydrolase [Streptococcus pneumoniae]|nr:chlorohydrolase [Streptococcus pneumoniae]CVR07779.1 chlorohydrolase [Streptococcus pneumoniae]